MEISQSELDAISFSKKRCVFFPPVKHLDSTNYPPRDFYKSEFEAATRWSKSDQAPKWHQEKHKDDNMNIMSPVQIAGSLLQSATAPVTEHEANEKLKLDTLTAKWEISAELQA